MATVTQPTDTFDSVADLVERLGGIPAHRIRLNPAPGTATEQDLIRINEQKDGGLFELIDGVLAGKAVASFESRVAAVLIRLIGNFLVKNHLGIVFAPDAMFRMQAGTVRLPDVSVVTADQFDGEKLKKEAISSMQFDLAVEILSESNTKREMEIKRTEYFGNGTKQVWIVNPRSCTVDVYCSMEEFATFGVNDEIDGGDVLPGFTLSIKQWFNEAENV